jgi:hypothetical protein
MTSGSHRPPGAHRNPISQSKLVSHGGRQKPRSHTGTLGAHSRSNSQRRQVPFSHTGAFGAHSKLASQRRQEPEPRSQTGVLGEHSKFDPQGRQKPLSHTGSSGDWHCASDVHSGVTHFPRTQASGEQWGSPVHSAHTLRNPSHTSGSIQSMPMPQNGAQYPRHVSQSVPRSQSSNVRQARQGIDKLEGQSGPPVVSPVPANPPEPEVPPRPPPAVPPCSASGGGGRRSNVS